MHRPIKPIRKHLGSLVAPLRRAAEGPKARLRTMLGILRLRRRVAATESPRIVVGASEVYEAGWIPTDVDYLNLLRPADWERFFGKDSLAAILAEHVWEHLTPDEVGKLAARAKAKRLVVTHYVAGGTGEAEKAQYLATIKKEYAGPAQVANDLERF